MQSFNRHDLEQTRLGIRAILHCRLGAHDLDGRTAAVAEKAIQRAETDPACFKDVARATLQRCISQWQGDTALTPAELAAQAAQQAAFSAVLASMPKLEREVLARFYVRVQDRVQICEEMRITEIEFGALKSSAKGRLTATATN